MIEIELKDKIKVKPEFVYESNVVKSGNGGVIKSRKRFVGKKAIIIIMEGIEMDEKKKKKKEKTLDEVTQLDHDLNLD